jgi:hypothetical protein
MRRSHFALCLLFVLPICSRVLAKDAPVPPEPEQFVDEGRYSDYAAKAESYLIAQPDAPASPRVAMDLLIAAEVFDDRASAIKMSELLLSEYPTSLQARYMVANLHEASDFTGLMAEIASEGMQNMPAEFPVKYMQAERLGLARFGATALGSGAPLIRTTLLARLAGDTQMAGACIQLMNSPSQADERQVLIAVADDSRPVIDRLKQLHTLTNRALAVPFEQYLLDKLSDADRQTSDVLRIEAENDLFTGQLSDSLPLLKKMAPGGVLEPRLAFWQAWATAAAGNSADAAALMNQLAQTAGNDPWGKQAADLAPALGNVDNSVNHNVEAALLASRGLTNGLDQIEAQATYIRPDGVKLDAYFAHVGGKLFELEIQRDGKTFFVYRDTDKDCTIFLDGQPAIYHSDKPGVVLVPMLAIRRLGNNFLFAGGMKFTYQLDDFETALTNILGSPNLSTRDGLQDLLNSTVRRGIVPLPPTTAGGNTVYAWVKPSLDTPDVTRVEFTVASNDQITAISSGQFNLTNLKYGPAGSFALTKPAMPTGKTIESGPLDANLVAHLVSTVVNQFSPPPTTQPAATEPATQPAN